MYLQCYSTKLWGLTIKYLSSGFLPQSTSVLYMWCEEFYKSLIQPILLFYCHLLYLITRASLWLNGKEYICLQCRRCGFDPWVGKIPFKKKWQPTPVFLPCNSHGQKNPVGYSPWDCKESDTTGLLTLSLVILSSWVLLSNLPQYMFQTFKMIRDTDLRAVSDEHERWAWKTQVPGWWVLTKGAWVKGTHVPSGPRPSGQWVC